MAMFYGMINTAAVNALVIYAHNMRSSNRIPWAHIIKKDRFKMAPAFAYFRRVYCDRMGVQPKPTLLRRIDSRWLAEARIIKKDRFKMAPAFE